MFKLGSVARDGGELWAYRYRGGDRSSKRIQKGGFASEQDAWAALERELEKLRRRNRIARTVTLAELVDLYLAQHEASVVTLEKLRWLLRHATAAFGGYRLDELRPDEIAAWRMTIRQGYRFEATQALRQVLARAVVWGMIDFSPAKQGVENPQRRRTEKRPFESWAELEAVAERLGPMLGPMVLFAAATGSARANGSRSSGETSTATAASPTCGVPSAKAVCAVRRPRRACGPYRCRHGRSQRSICFGPAVSCFCRPQRSGYLDLHNFRNRNWKPAQQAAGVEPFGRISVGR